MTRPTHDLGFAQTNDAMEWARAFCTRLRDGTFGENGVGVDEGLMVGWFANAMAAQEQADRKRDPLTDAIADLADAMTGIRERMDRELDGEAARRRDDDERSGERDPARWQEALRDLHASLRGAVTMAKNESVTLDGGVDAREDWLAEYLTREIDRRLRNGSGWSLKYALQTLGGDPPKDLRAEAEKFADQHVREPDRPEVHAAVVEAYLAGAGVNP